MPKRNVTSLPVSAVVFVGLIGLASVTSAGCSSSDIAPVAAGPSAEQACGDLANLYCTRVDECSHLFTQSTYPDLAGCKAVFKAECQQTLSAPGTGATPQVEADCTSAAGSTSCGDLFSNVLAPQCLPPAGRLADGASCGDDAQCTSKYCSTGDDTVCGKCGAPPAAGASCATQRCGPGLQCHKDDSDATGKTKTCVLSGKDGDTCSGAAPCRADLSCTDGKCGPAAANEGDTCSGDGKGAPQCNLPAGLVCLPTTKKCIKVKLAGSGAPCGFDTSASALIICANEGVCKKAKTLDPMGTCLGGAAVGQVCNDDDTIGPKCLLPGKCLAGTCVAPDPASCK